MVDWISPDFNTPVILMCAAARQAEIRRLVLLQPGNDGGRPKTRFNRVDFDVDAVAAASLKVRTRAYKTCMRLFCCKTAVSMSEVAFGNFMEAQRQSFLESEPGGEEHAVAAIFPTTFKAMLNLFADKDVRENIRSNGRW